MTYTVVTSFSKAGYETYGKRFLETFRKHDPDTPLFAYSEDGPFQDRTLYVREMFGWEWTFKQWRKAPLAQGILGAKRRYNLDADRFSHKVGCITSFADTAISGWLIWHDADVEITAKPDWSKVCPPNKMLSYIGRTDWHHSECGFVGYNLDFPQTRAFLERFRWYYTSGMIFSLREWHDSFVFDRVREDFSVWKGLMHNIAEGVPGMHPWPQTPLGKWSVHNKGPEAKIKAYGALV